MKLIRRSNRFIILIFALGLMLGGLIQGCAGGGGDGGGTPPPPGSPQTGTVAVFLTDDEIDNLAEVNVSVRVLVLIGADNKEERIFTGLHRVNLLDLFGIGELFAARPDIPAGSYDGFRMEVSDPEIVRLDGIIIPAEKITLGNLNVNILKVPIQVSSGQITSLWVDLKLDQSISVGTSGYLFDPLVDVEVINGLPTLQNRPDLTVSVKGEIESINPSDCSFMLKPADSDSSSGNLPQLLHVVIANDPISGTIVLRGDMEEIGKCSMLQPMQHINIIGSFSAQNDLDFQAGLIDIGQYMRLKGKVQNLQVPVRMFTLMDNGSATPVHVLDTAYIYRISEVGGNFISQPFLFDGLMNGNDLQVLGYLDDPFHAIEVIVQSTVPLK